MNMENLTIEEIKWLLNDYNRIRNFGKVNQWIDYHVRCMQLIKGSAEKPSCSCSWAATARVASSTYEQHEQALKYRLVILETPVIEDDHTGIDRVASKRGRGRSKTNTEG
jgi:hypothetical protein